VPIGERYLLPGYEYFLNLGGIANISRHGEPAGTGEAGRPGAGTPGTGGGDGTGTPGTGERGDFVAFDVCPANRVLNSLAGLAGKGFDEGGALAAGGRVDVELLGRLNALPYYGMGYPKSLGNEFGMETVVPMVREAIGGASAVGARGNGLGTADGLRTYVEHIVVQVRKAVEEFGGVRRAGAGETETGGAGDAGAGGAGGTDETKTGGAGKRMLVTGGGAHNTFLMERLREALASLDVEVMVPEAALVDYKEALVMALIGVLRWREENNVLASVTGASRDSIGGAVWIGQEA
jgi:anhydro-N-acetylmuramic acid kinase